MARTSSTRTGSSRQQTTARPPRTPRAKRPAAAAPPPPPQPEPAEAPGDANGSKALAARVAAQEAAIKKHEAELPILEVRERTRARTALAISLQVVACRWAAPIWREGVDAPVEWVWGERKCPFGKSEPDQDCRDCAHVMLIPVGNQNVSHHLRRYHDHGLVFPVPDQETADKLSAFVTGELGITHLRHPAQELHGMRRRLDELKRAHAEAVSREAEAAQEARARHQTPAPADA